MKIYGFLKNASREQPDNNIFYGAPCVSKSIHIDLNKTYAVYLTSSHCNLALYMITRLITRYFIIHIVVYKVTW